MAALESNATFLEELRRAKLEDLANQMEALGWANLGDFAFSTTYVPGMADDTDFVNSVVIPLLQDASSPRKAGLRRLHFKAYSLVAADMQRRATRTGDDDEKPVKLAPPERKARWDKIKADHACLDLTKEMEPSHA